MTNILKEIVSNHGYVTSKQLPELAELHPTLPLVIKWERAPRGVYPANEIAAKIKVGEKMGDYAREVFISATSLDTIRETIK